MTTQVRHHSLIRRWYHVAFRTIVFPFTPTYTATTFDAVVRPASRSEHETARNG